MSKEKKYDKKPSDHVKFFTASAAVYSVLEDIQAGVERYNQFLKFAIDGIRLFNFDYTPEIKFIETEMGINKQIEVPCDFVDWSLIGFKVGTGLRVFTQDKRIPLRSNCPPVSEASTSSVVEFLGCEDYFNNCNGGDHYYGATMDYNFAGYFRVDYRNRVINFENLVNNVNKVYMDYITDGVNYSGQTIIPAQSFRALQLYIHWQRKEYDDRYNQGESERAKRIYEEEMDAVLVRNMNMSLDDIKEIIRSSYKQTVKG